MAKNSEGPRRGVGMGAGLILVVDLWSGFSLLAVRASAGARWASHPRAAPLPNHISEAAHLTPGVWSGAPQNVGVLRVGAGTPGARTNMCKSSHTYAWTPVALCACLGE